MSVLKTVAIWTGSHKAHFPKKYGPAMSSFPVPVSPRMRTVLGLAAMTGNTLKRRSIRGMSIANPGVYRERKKRMSVLLANNVQR